MSGVGGVYKGPAGQELYGDGHEVNPVRSGVTTMANKAENVDDLVAAHAYRETLVPRADEMKHGVYPLWYGWAIEKAYLAGLKAGREEQKR